MGLAHDPPSCRSVRASAKVLEALDEFVVLHVASCPVKQEMEEFIRLQNMYTEADFAVVYIEEAHSSDGWVTGGRNFSIEAHTSMEDRLVGHTAR